MTIQSPLPAPELSREELRAARAVAFMLAGREALDEADGIVQELLFVVDPSEAREGRRELRRAIKHLRNVRRQFLLAYLIDG